MSDLPLKNEKNLESFPRTINPEEIETISPAAKIEQTPQDPPEEEKNTNADNINSLVGAAPVKNVVDKSEEPLELHPLKKGDRLTTIADKEEEEFIKKVEAAHEQHN